MTPWEYLTVLRMNSAQLLLTRRHSYSIGEIGSKCGYDDNVHFSRVFKKYTGMTPTQYRRSHISDSDLL